MFSRSAVTKVQAMVITVIIVVAVGVVVYYLATLPAPTPTATPTPTPSPTPSPNESMILSDDQSDFVIAEGAIADIKIGLSSVDITEVKVSNDGKNLVIDITTSEALPSVGPEYPECYVCIVRVMADHDGSKFAGSDIIIDDLGWDFGTAFAEDPQKIKYDVDRKKISFIFALDMKDWGTDPEVMSFYVQLGYENHARVYDFVPQQAWGKFEYTDYKLWKA